MSSTPRPPTHSSLAKADLVVVNGLGFEGWIDRLVRSSGYRGPVVLWPRGVTLLRRAGRPDPHAWQSLGRRSAMWRTWLPPWCAAAWFAAEACARAAAYTQRIGQLDANIRERMAAVPRGTPHRHFPRRLRLLRRRLRRCRPFWRRKAGTPATKHQPPMWPG
jgi:zinc/manganese transport system substrate-binding protein